MELLRCFVRRHTIVIKTPTAAICDDFIATNAHYFDFFLVQFKNTYNNIPKYAISVFNINVFFTPFYISSKTVRLILTFDF